MYNLACCCCETHDLFISFDAAMVMAASVERFLELLEKVMTHTQAVTRVKDSAERMRENNENIFE